MIGLPQPPREYSQGWANQALGQIANALSRIELMRRTANVWTAVQSFTADLLQTGAGAIGYGAGSGATVTQSTSKATAVLLVTMSGQIVTHNASLAAGASVSFTVNCTRVRAGDVPMLAIASGATAGAYVLTVDAVADFSYRVSIHNRSGGALAESLTINVAIIRASST